MGIGDELMVMGEAAAISREFGGAQIVVSDRFGKRRWHPIWTGAPYIRQPDDNRGGIGIRNGPGCRPYIASVSPDRFVFSAYTPKPADLAYVSGEPPAGRYIVIEPRLKPGATQNKAWPGAYWRELIDRMSRVFRGDKVVVLGTDAVPGVETIRTETFSAWVVAMRAAALYIGHEGGSHHMAAAVGVPAVVLFGGFVSPASTGYAWHANLTGGAKACGSRRPCEHCAEVMRSITVEHVLAAAVEKINKVSENL